MKILNIFIFTFLLLNNPDHLDPQNYLMYKDRMMNLMREVFELMQKEGRRSNIDIENVYNFEQKLAKVSPITVRN